MDDELYKLAEQVIHHFQASGKQIVTIESCSGGWVSKCLTDISGSSNVLDRGYVVYNADAKHDMLGVSQEIIKQHGEVSEEVVAELVSGGLERSNANIALAISGIAGPGGATATKPVGMVCFAWGTTDSDTVTETKVFAGDRDAVRRQAVTHSLNYLLEHF